MSLTMTDANASWGARHHSVPTETVFGHLSGFWGLTRCVPNYPLTLVWGRNKDVGITSGGFWLSPRDTTKNHELLLLGFSFLFFSQAMVLFVEKQHCDSHYKTSGTCFLSPSSPNPSCALSIALSGNEECQKGIEFFFCFSFYFLSNLLLHLLSSTPPLLHPPTHPHPVHLPSHTTPPLYRYPTLSTQTHDKLPCQQNSFRDQLIPQKWTRSHQLLKNSKCRERGS